VRPTTSAYRPIQAYSLSGVTGVLGAGAETVKCAPPPRFFSGVATGFEGKKPRSGLAMPKQVGNQNSKCLLRLATFGSFSKLYHRNHSFLSSLDIKHFWCGYFPFRRLLRPEATAPSARLSYAISDRTATVAAAAAVLSCVSSTQRHSTVPLISTLTGLVYVCRSRQAIDCPSRTMNGPATHVAHLYQF